MIPLVLTALLVLVLAWRVLARRSVERSAAARLPVGPDGLIVGAGPIDLPADSPDGVLLLHGFGDTPQALTSLAVDLHARGYGVYAPLLPGHGRTLRDFRASGEREWTDAARAALDTMRQRYQRVALVGLSMGGALAATLAAEHADTPVVVLLAPYLVPPRQIRLIARNASLVGALTPYLPSRNGRSILDPEERRKALGYGASTARLVADLVRVADRAYAALPRVSAPTLYVQSRDDHRIPADGAARAFAAVGASDKRLEWLTGAGHVITVDYGWPQVVATVGGWIDRVLRSRAD
jgi:carboxylesterase